MYLYERYDIECTHVWNSLSIYRRYMLWQFQRPTTDRMFLVNVLVSPAIDLGMLTVEERTR